MTERTSKEMYKLSPHEIRRLIRFRIVNEKEFLRSKFSAKKQWEKFVKENNLDGKVTGQQVAKKWENLKQKYKLLRTPKTGSGTDNGEVTASTWQFYEDMHEALGSRPSIDPPVVVASFQQEDPTTILMEIIEPSAASTSTPDTSPETPESTQEESRTSPPPKKRRGSNKILDFLMEESEKEQRRHEETDSKTERFLSLFEKFIDKI